MCYSDIQEDGLALIYIDRCVRCCVYERRVLKRPAVISFMKSQVLKHSRGCA